MPAKLPEHEYFWDIHSPRLGSETCDMFCMGCPRGYKALEDLRVVNRDQLFTVSSRTRKNNPLQANSNRFKASPELKMIIKWKVRRGLYHACLPWPCFSHRNLPLAKMREQILSVSLV